MDGIKKRLCNPPAVRVAETGDPEVCGMFEGAGDALAHILSPAQKHEAQEYRTAVHAFEKEVVTLEAAYITARKKLAEDVVARMHKAINAFVKGTGGEVYGGG